MKAKDVLKLLGICRVTLYKYVKSGRIKVNKLDNGYYDYDDDTVLKVLKKDSRINIIYARVSTNKQKPDLANQLYQLTFYCKNNKINVSKIISEISSGIDLDRKKLSILIDDVIHYRIKNIYITHKDRLTRLSFSTLEFVFNKFGTNVIVINDPPNKTHNNDSEIFEELLSLLHIFSTSMYSNRRKKKLGLIKDDLKLFSN